MKRLTTHRHIAWVILDGIMVTALCFLIAMQWLHEQAQGRINDKLGSIEVQQRDQYQQNYNDMVATRIIILALASKTPAPIEKVESDVRKATAARPLSPVLVDLLDELHKRSQAKPERPPRASPPNHHHQVKGPSPKNLRAGAHAARPKVRK